MSKKIIELVQLKNLFESKRISDDEFKRLKQEILMSEENFEADSNSSSFQNDNNVSSANYFSLTRTLIDSSLILGFVFFLYGALQKILHTSIADTFIMCSIYYLLFILLLLAVSNVLFKFVKNEHYKRLVSIGIITLLVLSFVGFGIFLIYILKGHK